MRADVHGGVKKYIVLSSGPGFKPTRHGERRRKLVRGRTVTDETYQINFTLTKAVPAEKKESAQPKPAEKPMATKQPEKVRPKKAAKRPSKKSK